MLARLPVFFAIAASLPGCVFGQTLSVSPASLSFTGNSNGIPPPAQAVTITNTGTAASPLTVSWDINISWLHPAGLNTNALSGGASTTIQVYASTQGISQGTYDGTFTVSGGGNGPQTVAVHYVVGPQASGPVLAISPTAFTFAGNSNGVAPPAQTITITNNTGIAPAALDVQQTFPNAPWLSVAGLSTFSLAAGASTTVQVNASTQGTAPGTYDATILIRLATVPQSVSVHFVVGPAGKSAISVSSPLNLTAMAFASRTSSPKTITVHNTGDASANITLSGNQSWLGGGTVWIPPQSSADVAVFANTTLLAAGTYDGVVLIAGGDNGTQNLAVHLTVIPTVAGPPTFDAVVNAASFVNQGVAPTEIVTIFGLNLGPAAGVATPMDGSVSSAPTVLAGTRVLFAGIPAPILYTQFGQVNAIVPQFPLDPSGQLAVQVEYQGVLSAPVSVEYSDLTTVASVFLSIDHSAIYAPGIFTLDESGQGQAVALNQDRSLNSAANPAARGSTISLFATGLGPTNPVTADGQFVTTGIAAATAATALFDYAPTNGISVLASSTGLSPGFFNGVYRVDVPIPTQLPSGTVRVSVYFLLPTTRTVPRVSSSPYVTIELK